MDHLKLDMLPLIPTKIINSERTWTFKNNLFAWFLILGNNVTRMKKKKNEVIDDSAGNFASSI